MLNLKPAHRLPSVVVRPTTRVEDFLATIPSGITVPDQYLDALRREAEKERDVRTAHPWIISAEALGFGSTARMREILQKAAAFGLKPCSIRVFVEALSSAPDALLPSSEQLLYRAWDIEGEYRNRRGDRMTSLASYVVTYKIFSVLEFNLDIPRFDHDKPLRDIRRVLWLMRMEVPFGRACRITWKTAHLFQEFSEMMIVNPVVEGGGDRFLVFEGPEE